MTWQLMAAVLGGIVLIGNAGAVIYKWLRPALKVKNDITEVKKDIVRLQEHEKKDLTRLDEIQKMNKIQCSAMLSMMNHMIDGNHVEKMKHTRDEIQSILADM